MQTLTPQKFPRSCNGFSHHLTTLVFLSPSPAQSHLSRLSVFLSQSIMKLTVTLNPKHLFRSRTKSRFISGSDQSFSSSSDDSSSHNYDRKGKVGKETPTTVLPREAEMEVSGEWMEMTRVFEMMDKDGDGKITREEIEAMLCRVGGTEPLSQEELALIFTEVDRDGDGCISLEEFGAVSSAFGPPSCSSELRDTFDFFDTDHDGRITAEELQAVFSIIGDGAFTLEDCRRMISGVDHNGDGFVCFDDFAHMMEQQR